jgi:exopolysaccharide biosynthesis polyprenyl glycosylphosphotransferase
VAQKVITSTAYVSVNLLDGWECAKPALPALQVDPFAPPRVDARGTRASRLRRLLVLTDVALLGLALFIVEVLRWITWGDSTPAALLMAFGAVSIPAWLVLAHANGLYHAGSYRVEHDAAEEVGPIMRVTTLWAWSMFLAVVLTRGAVNWLEQLAVLWAVVCVLSITGRAVARAYGRRQAWYLQNALVLGTSSQAASIVRKLMRHPEFGVHVVAVVDLERNGMTVERSEEFAFVPVISAGTDLGTLVDTYDVDRVVIGSSSYSTDRNDVLHRLGALGIQIDVIPTPFEALGARVDVHHLEGAPLMTLPRPRLGRSAKAMKRALDIGASAVALVLLLPLLAVCAVAIKLDSRGPLFFRQTRVGRDGRRFKLWKFRSMYPDADARKEEFAELNLHDGPPESCMFKIRQDPRVTRVGRILRRYSLDELPQLCNVLVGDMSLVGPRPLIEKEARQVNGRFRHRLSLTPGVTGLWQVNGRSEIPFTEMVSLDYLYVTNWTLWGDVKLLMKTLPAVARGNGAY